MTGLLGVIIGVILLVAIVAIFFLTIEKIVRDPLLQKIGKIVVGVIALIYVITAAWGALFGGGGGGLPHADGRALIYFAIGLLVIIAVVFLLNMLIAFFGFMVAELQYILSIVALIAILVVAAGALFGGNLGISIGKLTYAIPITVLA
jgi:hypothetical protein